VTATAAEARLPRALVLANLAGFNLNWFATIIAAGRGVPWVGPVLLTALVGLHLRALGRRGGRGAVAAEVRLIAIAAAVGYAADSLLVLAGVLSFPPGTRLGAPSTVWMVGLWIALACTLRVSLAWMRGRWTVAAVFGFVGGFTSYLAGERLGAVSLPGSATMDLLAVGTLWAVAMPGMLVLEARTRAAPNPAPAGTAPTRPAEPAP